MHKTGKYYRSKLLKESLETFPTGTNTAKGPRTVNRDMEEFLKNYGRVLDDLIDGAGDG